MMCDYKASQNITKTRLQIYMKNQEEKKKQVAHNGLSLFPRNVPFYNPQERVAPFLILS